MSIPAVAKTNRSRPAIVRIGRSKMEMTQFGPPLVGRTTTATRGKGGPDDRGATGKTCVSNEVLCSANPSFRNGRRFKYELTMRNRILYSTRIINTKSVNNTHISIGDVQSGSFNFHKMPYALSPALSLIPTSSQ
jgi:hypothetical protein